MHSAAIEVAVGILRSPDGRVLMAERTARQISPGYWEFPGGKIDPGESAAQAVVRELDEEIGIRASSVRAGMCYVHRFPLRRVRLHFFHIDAWTGSPHGREGQRVAWVDAAQPLVDPILPSCRRALQAIALPGIYGVLRAESSRQSRPFEELESALQRGVRLFQLRAANLAPDQRIALARRAQSLAGGYGARVLLCGSALEARRAGMPGVHSTAEELRRLAARPPVDLWMASCHDGADLQRAEQLGADAVVLSPVLASGAHPDAAPIGWDGLRRLAAEAPIGVYAQGGMNQGMLGRAQQAGAIGIAANLGAI
jgi:8-oxo-dGTP diphosphatase